MVKKLIIFIALSFSLIGAKAQVFQMEDGGSQASDGGSQKEDGRGKMEDVSSGKATENVVVADGFWKDWFVQMGQRPDPE